MFTSSKYVSLNGSRNKYESSSTSSYFCATATISPTLYWYFTSIRLSPPLAIMLTKPSGQMLASTIRSSGSNRPHEIIRLVMVFRPSIRSDRRTLSFSFLVQFLAKFVGYILGHIALKNAFHHFLDNLMCFLTHSHLGILLG